jgi:hypothetical protein
MNRNVRILLSVVAAGVVMSLAACDTTFNIPSGALAYVSQSQLNALAKMGLKIYDGATPPTVTGDYYCNSLVRTGGNIPDDTSTSFSNLGLRFTSQGVDNSVVVTYDQSGIESGTGLGAFISGSGNNFSIYVQITGTSAGLAFKDAMVFSGTKTATGIKDFVYALLLTDKDPDPYGALIEVDQGRVIKEDDGLAATSSSYPYGMVARALQALQTNNSR